MFKTAVWKEFILVFRDLHALLVLFLMPIVFITIMSLAMQEQFGTETSTQIKLLVDNSDGSQISLDMVEYLQQISTITIEKSYQNSLSTNQLLSDSKALALIKIPATLEVLLSQQQTQPKKSLEIWYSPTTNKQTSLLILAAVKEAFAKTLLQTILTAQRVENVKEQVKIVADDSISIHYQKINNKEQKTPSSVQQSVPAWLIFSMFFVVIPLSNTLINEKQFGTLKRLRSMNISAEPFLLSKILPYLLINQLQFILMLLVGVYLIPLLGGDRLSIGQSWFALWIMALAVGIAALGYGLLIAVIAKTTEQATSMGGVGNILFGALGGIMVPKFIMPEYLQTMTNFSPMSWGLEGFLDLFLLNGKVDDIIPEVLALLGFGLVSLMIALVMFKWAANKGEFVG